MNRIALILLLLCPALAPAASMTPTDTDRLLREGIAHQLRSDYSAAAEVAARLKQIAPDTGIGEAMHLNSLVTRVSWNPADTQFDEDIEANAGALLARCERGAPLDAQMSYRCGQANFALSFLHGVRGRMITAGVHGTRAIRLFERAIERQPNLIDPRMQLGMAYFYADNLPSFIKVIASLLWFVPKGDSDKALPYLRDVMARGEYFSDVAKFIYADIASESDDVGKAEALAVLTDLASRYPENARLHLSRIELLMTLDRTDEALATANHALAVATPFPERVLLTRLWRIQALIALGRHDDAREAGESLPEPPADFPAWGLPRYHLVRAQVADLAGQRDVAINRYRAALESIGRYASPAVRAMAQAGLESALPR